MTAPGAHVSAARRPARARGRSGTGARGRSGAPDRGTSLRRWPLGRIVAAGMVLLGVVLVAAVVAAGLAVASLDAHRARLTGTLDPAALHCAQLNADLLSQENGLRGYQISGQRAFLVPYDTGLADQRRQVAALRPLVATMPGARADLDAALRAVGQWRQAYAAPVLARPAGPHTAASSQAGPAQLDAVRTGLTAFQQAVAAQRAQASAALRASSGALDTVALASCAALLALLAALWACVRAAAVRPLARLAAGARQVAGGDFSHRVDPGGPREVHTLAADVNSMRERILQELSAVRGAHAALQARAAELERSNSDLEQFAYAASHDLQEPLRKVSGFCQLLQRRYAGQLDARADQYIEFAADGASRMQALVDDLLAFSRVSRPGPGPEPELASAASALSAARGNLAAQIREAGAVVEAGGLPAVRAEPALLTSLFQNLVANAVKFRGASPPRVRVSARAEEGWWRFSVQDNGIGIDPADAERIFVIFQRLHDRSAYEGTGIGLATCRKIVERYGGAIWLDTGYTAGARFCFTLPVAPAGGASSPGHLAQPAQKERPA